MINRIFFALIIAFVSFVITGAALAQTAGDMITIDDMQNAALGPPQDESIRLMSGVLGEKFATNPFSAVGAPTTLLGNVVFVFNAALFLVGTFVLTAQIIAIVAQSAQDGEPLGKKNSGLWMPIRLGTGIFGMLPVLGGFSISQGLMMSAIIIGIGAANIATNRVVDSAADMQSIVPSSAMMSGTNDGLNSGMLDAARSLAVLNICTETQNRYIEETTRNSRRKLDYITPEELITNKGKGLFFGSCGAIYVEKTGEIRRGDGMQEKLGFRIAAVNYDDIAHATNMAAVAQLNAMQDRIAPLAAYWVDAFEQGREGEATIAFNRHIDDIAHDARVALNESIKEHSHNAADGVHETLVENMKRGGWMRIGQWASIFGEVSSSIATAQSAYSYEFQPGRLINEKAFLNAGAGMRPNRALSLFLDHWETHLAEPEKPTETRFGECVFAGNQTATGECSIGQNTARKLIEIVAQDSGGPGLVNPIVAAKNLGDYMMVTGQIGLGASVASNFVPGLKAASIAINTAIPQAGQLMNTLMYFLIFMGLYLSVFVPMQIFLAWATAIISWAAMMIEAILMAQVWAFGHMKTDGDGIVDGPQRRGYIYLLHMIARPVLMVIGFVLCMVLLIFGGTFLINSFIPAMASAQGNSTTGVLTIVGYVIIFCVALFNLINISASMMTALPDKLLGWLGDHSGGNTGNAMIGSAVAGRMMSTRGPVGGGGGVAAAATKAAGGGKGSS